MNIKWLGHSSFLITTDNSIKIITDPYETSGDLKYNNLEESADIVTVSHNHADHNNVAVIKGHPRVVTGTVEVKGITFTGFPAYHDDRGGTQRGTNTIFRFEADGIILCHMGDLGHMLNPAQLSELGKIDVLCIPIGGFYTIDVKTAGELVNQIKPRIIIPMHYKNDKCHYPIKGVDEFLRGKSNIKRLAGSEVEIKAGELPAESQIFVFKPAN